MSKRQRPAPPKARRRWDRRQMLIALLAVGIVLLMVVSSLSVLFYGR